MSSLAVGLFAATLFSSAFLLFSVQPFVAKSLLPLLGGAPMVWNTSVVFFQALVLAGYAGAHQIARSRAPLAGVWIYVLLLIGGLTFLPVAFNDQPLSSDSPIGWLFAELASSAGLPVMALSMTAPLLQACYARTGLPRAQDPYFLYAASNAGSFAALFAYPILIEPALRLSIQSRWWTVGYGVCVLLAASSIVTTMLYRGTTLTADTAAPVPIAGWRRVQWVVLAFIPSSLMLGVTSYIATDIAAVPLLWVVPLALYLATFILAFSPRLSALVVDRVSGRMPFAVLTVTFLWTAHLTLPVYLNVPIHLIAFAVVALGCHGRLAGDRPPPGGLTEFYLLVSLGGVAGGIFNTLVAPLIFNTVLEYPLMLVAASAVPAMYVSQLSRREVGVATLCGVAVMATVAAWAIATSGDSLAAWRSRAFVLGLLILATFTQVRKPVRFPLMVGTLLLAMTFWSSPYGKVLESERTFFGSYKVTEDLTNRSLIHGTTLHGRQALAAEDSGTPLTYFHPSGPFGQAFERVAALHDGRRIGVIGLGVGALASYAREHQRWTFFEIDPAIERIARNPDFFTFLSRCNAKCNVILGDARLSLRESDERFDAIVLDAFSSDSIPIHLLTREAIDLYLHRLKPNGVLVFHISNRYLALTDVVARLSTEHGLTAARQLHRVPLSETSKALPSEWVVASAHEDEMRRLADDGRWTILHAPDDAELWTDDYSNIVGVMFNKPQP